jgi:DNA-binding FadR family transcriptional regulator
MEVVQSLVDQIISGAVPPETLLPSEADMSLQFGVSRTVIRESLNVLENTGLVFKRQGKLTLAAPSEHWDLLDPVVLATHIRHTKDLRLMDDLVVVRTALEAVLAAQAAERATTDELAQIASRLHDLDALLDDPEAYKAADGKFHEAILRSSKNLVGRAVVMSIYDEARATRQFTSTDTPLELILHSHRGHVAVFERVQERDAQGAEQAMREHILSAWMWRHNDLEAGWSQREGR